MYQITLSLSEETALALHLSPEELGQEISLAAAIKLYELGKFSAGAAADLAGIGRVVFLSKLASYGVDTFQLSEAELIEDMTNA